MSGDAEKTAGVLSEGWLTEEDLDRVESDDYAGSDDFDALLVMARYAIRTRKESDAMLAELAAAQLDNAAPAMPHVEYREDGSVNFRGGFDTGWFCGASGYLRYCIEGKEVPRAEYVARFGEPRAHG